MAITRRSFAQVASLLAVNGLGCLPFSKAGYAAEANSSEPVKFSWQLSRSYAIAVSKRLGVPEKNITGAPNSETDRGLPIVLIIVGAVALVALVKEIINVYRDLRYGGIIIQDKGGQLVIRNDPRLPNRVIIVKDKNGVTVHELKGEATASDLLNALPSVGGQKPKP